MAEITSWLGCFIFVQLLMVLLLVVLLVYIIGFRKCDDSAVVKIDTRYDPSNCGSIGTTCANGQICSNSVCTCTNGYTLVDGTCVDLKTNVNNCGTPENKCTGVGEICSDGVCSTLNSPFVPAFGPMKAAAGPTPVPAPKPMRKVQLTRLSPEQRCQLPNMWCPSTNECVGDYLTNRYHCGSCNTICAGDQDCVQGICQVRPEAVRPACSSCAGGIGRALQFE